MYTLKHNYEKIKSIWTIGKINTRIRKMLNLIYINAGRDRPPEVSVRPRQMTQRISQCRYLKILENWTGVRSSATSQTRIR